MDESKSSITEINIQLKELRRMKNEVLELNASELIISTIDGRIAELQKQKKEHTATIQENLKRER